MAWLQELQQTLEQWLIDYRLPQLKASISFGTNIVHGEKTRPDLEGESRNI